MASMVSLVPIASKYVKTVTNAAVLLTDAPFSFTAAQVAVADYADVTVETQGVRYTYDGTVPTASIGHLIAAGGQLRFEGNDVIKALQFIRSSGSDATVSVSLLRRS